MDARGDYLISDKDMSKEENLKLDNLRSLIKEMLAKKKTTMTQQKSQVLFVKCENISRILQNEIP